MQRLQLHLHLESDATFGRGEGVAGLVDEEVEYDTTTGLPFVRGRTLKGLLVEECANILFALEVANSPALPGLNAAAERLFGRPGSRLKDTGLLHVGHAQLPQELRQAVYAGVTDKKLHPAAVLEALTTIRRQTAIDEQSGTPQPHSLRSMRIVLHDITFGAWLDFASGSEEDDLALLAACVLSVRRGGMGRNRGRGKVSLRLLDEQGTDVTITPHFARFQHLVQGGHA